MPKRPTKYPIALLSDTPAAALNWALVNLEDIDFYCTTRVSTKNGQEYIIITIPEQLENRIISDYKDVGSNTRPASLFIELAEAALRRIRE